MTKNQQKQQQNNKNNGSSSGNMTKTQSLNPVTVTKHREGNSTRVAYQANPDETKYLRALEDPRRSDIDGVVVPDRFPFPTVPLKGCGKLILISNASGNITFRWFPTPTLTLFLINGTVSTVDSVYTVGANMVYAHSSDAAIALQQSTTRTVAAGFSIGNDENFSNIAGTGTATPFIGADCNINQADWTAGGANNTATSNVSNELSNSANANLVAAGSVEFKMDQLIKNDLLFTTRPVDPSGYQFRSTDVISGSIGNGYQTIQGGEYYSNATGLMSSTTRANAGNPKGMMGWVVNIVGLPASTACVVLDIFNHIEGDQTNVTAVNCNMVPSISQHRTRKGGNIESLLSYASTSIVKLVKPAVQSYVASIGGGLLAGMIR